MVRYAVGVDLGATNIRVVLGDDKGNFLAKAREKTIRKGRKEAIANQILRMIDSFKSLKQFKKIEGVGIGSIGPVDLKQGAIVHTPNIPFKFVPLKPIKRLGKPVYLSNDCQAAVLGEKFFGAGKGIDNIIYITLSSGIGGGAIVNGHLLSGEAGNAVEVGHFIVDTTYNRLCTCKKGRGHWEGYSSGENIPKFFKQWAEKEKAKVNFSHSSAREIFEAAKRKNRVALKFVKELGKINARAISNVMVAYNPTLITLGGSVTLHNKDLILKPIKDGVDKYLPLPKIKVTPLGDDVVLYGALASVFAKEGGRL